MENVEALLRTDEQAREEFIYLLEKVGGTKAQMIILEEVGFLISRATFYKVKNGQCKPTILHLLTYALRNAVDKLE